MVLSPCWRWAKTVCCVHRSIISCVRQVLQNWDPESPFGVKRLRFPTTPFSVLIERTSSSTGSPRSSSRASGSPMRGSAEDSSPGSGRSARRGFAALISSLSRSSMWVDFMCLWCWRGSRWKLSVSSMWSRPSNRAWDTSVAISLATRQVQPGLLQVAPIIEPAQFLHEVLHDLSQELAVLVQHLFPIDSASRTLLSGDRLLDLFRVPSKSQFFKEIRWPSPFSGLFAELLKHNRRVRSSRPVRHGTGLRPGNAGRAPSLAAFSSWQLVEPSGPVVALAWCMNRACQHN